MVRKRKLWNAELAAELTAYRDRYALGPTQALGRAAWQPKGTRDGSRALKGHKVYICRCTSERCGISFGAYATRQKARARKRKMETESGCTVEIETWMIT